MFWALILSAALGAPQDAFKQQVAVGPLPLTACYAALALGINELNAKHPDKDFRGLCSPTMRRRAGDRSYDLQTLSALALGK